MKRTLNDAEPSEKARAQKSAMKQASPQPELQGPSWQFYLIIAVIMLGVLSLVGKALGLF